jgi:hypothetical protein
VAYVTENTTGCTPAMVKKAIRDLTAAGCNPDAAQIITAVNALIAKRK